MPNPHVFRPHDWSIAVLPLNNSIDPDEHERYYLLGDFGERDKKIASAADLDGLNVAISQAGKVFVLDEERPLPAFFGSTDPSDNSRPTDKLAVVALQ